MYYVYWWVIRFKRIKADYIISENGTTLFMRKNGNYKELVTVIPNGFSIIKK